MSLGSTLLNSPRKIVIVWIAGPDAPNIPTVGFFRPELIMNAVKRAAADFASWNGLVRLKQY